MWPTKIVDQKIGNLTWVREFNKIEKNIFLVNLNRKICVYMFVFVVAILYHSFLLHNLIYPSSFTEFASFFPL